MGFLNVMQIEHRSWALKNFGSDRQSDDPLIGITEELGELCHAHLKTKQGIRTNENHYENKVDALADMVIYMLDYCNLENIDLEEAIKRTWSDVRKRDWTKHKANGRTD